MVSEVSQTFPKPFTTEQRLLAIYRQVGDAGVSLAKLQGLQVNHTNGADSDHKLRIAAILIDVFILANDYEVDIEAELEKAVAWFQTKRSS